MSHQQQGLQRATSTNCQHHSLPLFLSLYVISTTSLMAAWRHPRIYMGDGVQLTDHTTYSLRYSSHLHYVLLRYVSGVLSSHLDTSA